MLVPVHDLDLYEHLKRGRPSESEEIDLNQHHRFSCQEPFQQIARAEFEETGGRAVGAGVEGAFGDGAVHHQMDAGSLREDGAEDGGGSDFDACEFPEFFRRCERDAGDAQGAAEFAGDEGFVVGGDVQVELRLLAIAQEDGLDDADANLGVDVLAVFHRQTRVRVHALEGNAPRGEGFIDLLLQFRRVGRRRRREDIADFEHRLKFRRQGFLEHLLIEGPALVLGDTVTDEAG